MANESYEDFARGLQHEYENECGITFGKVPLTAFAKLLRVIDGEERKIGLDAAGEIRAALVEQKLLDQDGRLLPAFDPKKPGFSLALPPAHADLATTVVDLLASYQIERHVSRDRDERVNHLRKEVQLKCTNSAHCQNGYACVVPPGLCERTVDAGGRDMPVLFDGAVAFDGPRGVDMVSSVDSLGMTDLAAIVDASLALDAGPDAPSASGPEAAASLDTPSISGPEVTADLSTALSMDTAPDRTPDTTSDSPIIAVDVAPSGLEVGPDLPSVKTRGASCSLATECADGFCADGYCCDSACKGQACDVASALGKCTPLAKGATSHTGHGACTASDVACAGSCDGASGSCFYPSATNACGTASCTGTTYQPVGTCNAGACTVPATQPCPTNQTCSTNACACLSPKLTCSGACIDPQSDDKNCGACGHDCQGGTCLQGQCQPVVVAGNLDVGGGQMFGLDSQYAYYISKGTYPTVASYRIAKTSVNGMGTLLSTGCSAAVIGSTLFQCPDRGIGSSCNLNTCGTTMTTLPDSGQALPFGSPTPQNYTIMTTDPAYTSSTFSWYDTNNNLAATYLEGFPIEGNVIEDSVIDSWSAGTSVYWLEAVSDQTGAFKDIVAYKVDSTTSVRAQLAGSISVRNIAILDVNPQSVLFGDRTAVGNIYRVPLPFGMGSSAPAVLLSQVSIYAITESSSFVYWVDSGNTMYKCAPSNCQGTTVILTNGRTISGSLYQDATFLYWGERTPGQIVKMAK